MSYKSINQERKSFTFLPASVSNPFKRSTSIDITSGIHQQNELFYYTSSQISEKIAAFKTSSSVLRNVFIALVESKYQDAVASQTCDSKFNDLKKLRYEIYIEIENLKNSLDLGDDDGDNSDRNDDYDIHKINQVNTLTYEFQSGIDEAISKLNEIDKKMVRFIQETYPVATDQVLDKLTANSNQSGYEELLAKAETEDEKQQLTSVKFVCIDRIKLISTVTDFKTIKEKLKNVTTKPPMDQKRRQRGKAGGAAGAAGAAGLFNNSSDLEKGNNGGGGKYSMLNHKGFSWLRKRQYLIGLIMFIVAGLVIFGVGYGTSKRSSTKDSNKSKPVSSLSSSRASSLILTTSSSSVSSSYSQSSLSYLSSVSTTDSSSSSVSSSSNSPSSSITSVSSTSTASSTPITSSQDSSSTGSESASDSTETTRRAETATTKSIEDTDTGQTATLTRGLAIATRTKGGGLTITNIGKQATRTNAIATTLRNLQDSQETGSSGGKQVDNVDDDQDGQSQNRGAKFAKPTEFKNGRAVNQSSKTKKLVMKIKGRVGI